MKIKNKLSYFIPLIVLILGSIIVSIPNKNYLYTLNTRNYIILNILIVIICTISILITKLNHNQKTLLIMGISIIVTTTIVTYFYMNLPKYTYDDAVYILEKDIVKDSKNTRIFIPKDRIDKIGERKNQILKITNYIYFVYVENKNKEKTVYRFFPLEGTYEKTNLQTGKGVLSDIEVE